jgi:hypothetical protein
VCRTNLYRSIVGLTVNRMRSSNKRHSQEEEEEEEEEGDLCSPGNCVSPKLIRLFRVRDSSMRYSKPAEGREQTKYNGIGSHNGSLLSSVHVVAIKHIPFSHTCV